MIYNGNDAIIHTINFHLHWIKSAFKSNIYDYMKLKGVNDEHKFNEF